MLGTIMEEKVYLLSEGVLNEEQLKTEWKNVYDYLMFHPVNITVDHFGEGIINIIRNKA